MFSGDIPNATYPFDTMSLPNAVVDVDSVDLFKSILDKYLDVPGYQI